MSSHNDSFVASGSSPTEPDFICQNHGSLFLLIPCNDSANDWIEQNLSPDRLTFGRGVVVEPRYIGDIVRGAMADGLVVA